MRKLFTFLLVLSITIISLASQRPFIVGMELEYPPFETIDEKGNPTGACVDIARALVKDSEEELL